MSAFATPPGFLRTINSSQKYSDADGPLLKPSESNLAGHVERDIGTSFDITKKNRDCNVLAITSELNQMMFSQHLLDRRSRITSKRQQIIIFDSLRLHILTQVVTG